ncbi:hypothetical protein DLAC_04325 [Tieghemostelium lacteum]|uniref:E3 ubiquitin-protein ligase n=1 Tax=Tieghemostelium lacteum TaxID=361077 RepID=A0A151ZJ82_TIELA|nr:hypothetical protein DLAC_04325 [Tieghemostelium lacteum]|eukprot:KYQ94052.1 hypothetical protein DLAC_04325 [Tieghemostelium lacteum]
MGNSPTKNLAEKSSSNNNSKIEVDKVELYLPIYKSGKAELINYFVSQDAINQPKQIQQYLLWLKSQLYTHSIKPKQYVESVEYIFYLNTDIKKSKDFYKSLSKQIACSKVWGPKTMFYRCKTCALSPNSSICFECFKKGPHEKEGHDYSTNFGSFGGSCDCGSVDSWKMEGFCSDHFHPEVDPVPTSTMKPELLLVTHLVIRHMLLIVMEYPHKKDSRDNDTREYIETCTHIFEWLGQATESNRATSHVLSEELTYQTLNDTSYLALSKIQPLCFTTNSTDDNNNNNNNNNNNDSTSSEVFSYPIPQQYRPPLESILLNSSEELIGKFNYLFLYLLCEHRFKFGFSQTYIKVYPKLCKKENVDIIFKFSPQLFSVSSISEIFTIHCSYGFLQCTFDTLFKNFTSNINTDVTFDKHHIATISDIKTIIQHKSISHYIIYEKPDLLKLFLRLFKFIHNLDLHTRARMAHISMEGDDWATHFQMAVECRDISEIVISSLDKNDSLDRIRDIIAMSLEYFPISPDMLRMTRYQNVMVTGSDLFRAEKSVSLILPLHRYMGLLLQKVSSLHPNVPLSTLLPPSFNVLEFLYPLILSQVFTSQVMGSYWVRNGEFNLKKRIHVYSLFFIEIDISTIQLILSVPQNLEDFIIFTSKEFQATIPLSLRDETSSFPLANNNNNVVNYQHKYSHFLRFMIIIFQDRYFYQNDKTIIKTYLIQLLTAGQQAHSEIESVLMYMIKDNTFEDILAIVANEQIQTVDHPATFRLKNEFWKYYNSYNITFTLLTTDESANNYLKYKKSNNLPYPESLPPPPTLLSDKTSIVANSKFLQLIHSDYIHYMITGLLYNHYIGEITQEIPYGINECFYFILLSIKDHNQKHVNNDNDNDNNTRNNNGDDIVSIEVEEGFNSTSIIPWEKLSKPLETFGNNRFSIFALLQRYKMLDGQIRNTLQLLLEYLEKSSENNMYLEKKEFLVRSLELLADLHPEINDEILSLYPKFKIYLQSNQDFEKNKKLDAKKRQAEIMAKFIKQQNQFLLSTDMDDFEDVPYTPAISPQKALNETMNNIPVSPKFGGNTTTTTSSITTATTTSSSDAMSMGSHSPEQQVPEDEPVCILCLETRHTEKDPICLISYAQISSLLQYCKLKAISNHGSLSQSSMAQDLKSLHPLKSKFKKNSIEIFNSPLSFHMRSCSHYIHHQCYETYYNKVLLQSKVQEFFEDANSFKPKYKEFLCPMCRRIGNIIIPLSFNNSNSPIQQHNTSGDLSPSSFGSGTIVNNQEIFDVSKWGKQLKYQSKQDSGSSVNSTHSNHDFFYKLLDTIIKNNCTMVDSVTPNVLYQILMKNIEYLEFASRPLQENSSSNNNYATTFEIFSRDMLTIFTLSQAIKNQNLSASTVLNMIRGKSDSVLSMDPFSIFILLLFSTNPVTIKEYNNIIQFTLQLFTYQFYITQYLIDPNSLNNSSNSVGGSKKVTITSLNTFVKSNQEQLKTQLKVQVLPLLRQMFISLQSLYKRTSIQLTREKLSDKIYIYKLFDMEESSSIDALMKLSVINPLVTKWTSQLENKKLESFLIVNSQFPTFIKLPSTYEEFVVQHLKSTCTRCKTSPEHAAICLLCGGYICMMSSCCKDEYCEGFSHTLQGCGSFKIGFFIETRCARITNLRDFRKSHFTLAYLDQYGEPDPCLDRGKTLLRNDFHLQDLLNHWISHSLEDKFLSSSNLTGRFF